MKYKHHSKQKVYTELSLLKCGNYLQQASPRARDDNHLIMCLLCTYESSIYTFKEL